AGGAIVGVLPFADARWQSQVLTGIVAVVLCLRGRAFADVVQASVLIGSGVLTGLTLVAGMAVTEDDWLVTGAGAVLVLGLAAVGFGAIAPQAEVSPVVRRGIELFEYLLILLIVPLALWVMGVYSAARNLTF